MRRFAILFMIVTLPLRGWAADVMNVSMAVQQIFATINVASSAHVALTIPQFNAQSSSAMPADCPFMVQTAKLVESVGDGEALSALCKGCTTCQLCMAVVTGYPPMTGPALVLPQTEPLIGIKVFTSAERVSSFKPPIS